MRIDAQGQICRSDPIASESTTQRLLLVAEAIGRYGPVTLKRLCETLPFHRSSIWRAAAALKAQGWVRMRLGDNAFELTRTFDLRLASYHFAQFSIEGAESAIEMIQSEGIFFAELCQFIAPGQFMMIESARRTAEHEGLRSLVWDSAALAAQLTMTPTARRQHLKAYIARASITEREIINSGEHESTLRRHENEGVIWSPDELAVSLPWVVDATTTGAITAIAKSPSRKAAERLQNLAERLVAHQANAERMIPAHTR